MENFSFNGTQILDCVGKVKFNGVTVRTINFNGVHVFTGLWRPSEPLAFNATDTNCEQIEFTWNPPLDAGSGTYIYNLYENGIIIGNNVTSPHTITVRQSIPKTYHVAAVGSDCPVPAHSTTNDGASEWVSDAVSDFIASNINCSDITFTWTNAAEDGFPDATYDIYQGLSLIAAGAISGHVYATVDQTLLPFHVKSVNNCGSISSNIDNGQAATPPVAIADFNATDNQCGQITFTWTNDIMSDVYDLYQGASLVQANVVSGHILASGTLKTSVPYTVLQHSPCFPTTATSNINNGRIGWAPNAPTNFAASDNDTGIEGFVRCTWTNSSDVGNPTATYTVYRDNVVVATNATSGVLINNGSWDGNNTYYVRATNNCGFANSATNTGSAYQIDAPQTTTFTASGTLTSGTGHSRADVCMIGGGGSGSADDNNLTIGAGLAGAVISQNAIVISSNTNYPAVCGAGGGSVGTGSNGNPGSGSSIFGINANGGGGGSIFDIYSGNGASRTTCYGTANDGLKQINSGDTAFGGQAGFGNGGNGGILATSTDGSLGSGGGAAYGSNVAGTHSGSGGAGVVKVTTY